MISLANKATPYPIIQHLKTIPLPVAFFVGPLILRKKLPKQCTESMRVYADNAQKIKSAYHCTYRQISDIKFYHLSIKTFGFGALNQLFIRGS